LYKHILLKNKPMASDKPTTGMEVFDHPIIGHQRYVSMKERGLGFS
jgi:DNA repair protein RadC